MTDWRRRANTTLTIGQALDAVADVLSENEELAGDRFPRDVAVNMYELVSQLKDAPRVAAAQSGENEATFGARKAPVVTEKPAATAREATQARKPSKSAPDPAPTRPRPADKPAVASASSEAAAGSARSGNSQNETGSQAESEDGSRRSILPAVEDLIDPETGELPWVSGVNVAAPVAAGNALAGESTPSSAASGEAPVTAPNTASLSESNTSVTHATTASDTEIGSAPDIGRFDVEDDGFPSEYYELEGAASAGPPPEESGLESLETIRDSLGDCTRCPLHKERSNIVFGTGNTDARLMFVGEAPGRTEDRQGEPFVGEAGQLLTKMIGAMGLQREDVYIANVVKCRPPNNRDPSPQESATCSPFLRRQILSVAPEVIVGLGKHASTWLAGRELRITRERGQWMEYEGIAFMPTFHPSYLLRNASAKRPVWEDLQEVMRKLELDGAK